jgi:hypothetical protein
MYSYFARVGHPDIRWSIVSSYCLHRRHLLSIIIIIIIIRSGGVLLAISDTVSGVKRGSDMELIEECIHLWVKIYTTTGLSLLTYGHSFSPNCNIVNIKKITFDIKYN